MSEVNSTLWRESSKHCQQDTAMNSRLNHCWASSRLCQGFIRKKKEPKAYTCLGSCPSWSFVTHELSYGANKATKAGKPTGFQAVVLSKEREQSAFKVATGRERCWLFLPLPSALPASPTLTLCSSSSEPQGCFLQYSRLERYGPLLLNLLSLVAHRHPL